jgi:hypothetical protein
MPRENLVPLTIADSALTAACAETFLLAAAMPLRLDGGCGAWLVQSGRVDLFAVALADGEPSGARHPLYSAAAGDLLLAFRDTADRTVIGVGHHDTRVTHLTSDDLAAWPVEDRAMLIEGWLSRIATATFGETASFPELAAERGRKVPIAPGQRIHAPRDPVWVIPRAGSLCVGDGTGVLAGMIPIAAGLSLRAEDDCLVDCLTTTEALASGAAEPGLALFHRVILDGLGDRMARQEQAARERMAARAVGDRQNMDNPRWRLAATRSQLHSLQ